MVIQLLYQNKGENKMGLPWCKQKQNDESFAIFLSNYDDKYKKMWAVFSYTMNDWNTSNNFIFVLQLLLFN